MRDFINNEFARKWVLKNLDQRLDTFVLMGSSAGSLGAAIWSDYMLKTLSYKKASVFLDSYMGVLPTDTQGILVRSFGACSLPILDDFRAECEAGTVTVQDAFEHIIAKNPHVAFAHIQPKTDLVQRLFYTMVAWSFSRLDLIKTRTQMYRDTNYMMQRYNKYPNYVTYLVQGSWHVFAMFDFWYEASTAGFDSPSTNGEPSLAEWAEKLIAHEPVQSQCQGTLRKNGFLTIGSHYCDQDVFPKTLSLPAA